MSRTVALTPRSVLAALATLIVAASMLLVAPAGATDAGMFTTTYQPLGKTGFVLSQSDVVTGVSCSSHDNCVAIGATFMATEANGTWGDLTRVTLPAGGNLTGVSCPSNGNCTIVGYDSASSGTSLTLEQKNGTWGSPVEHAVIGGHELMLAVSCWSAGNCVATAQSTVQSQGVFYRETNGVWSDHDVIPGTYSGTVSFRSISCPSAANCSAVGYVQSSSTTPIVARMTNGSWANGTVNFTSGLTSGLSAVSCWSAGNCVAAGKDTATKLYVTTQTNGTWASTETLLSAAGGLQPASISCPSAGNCTIVGATPVPPYSSSATYVTQTNGTWGTTYNNTMTDPTITQRTANRLGGVSCVSSIDCTAVGNATGYDIFATRHATLSTFPGAPSGVTSTASAHGATTTWSAPASDGGAAITGYSVTLTPTTGAAVTCTPSPATATTCTSTGLTTGVTYTVSVTATNGVGTGAASATTTVVPLAGAFSCLSAPLYFKIQAGKLATSTTLATWSTVGTAHDPSGGLGYDTNDGFLYGVGTKANKPTFDHLVRIADDGSLTDLGAITGLPASTVVTSGDIMPGTDTLYVSSGAKKLWAINLTTRSATAVTLGQGVQPIVGDLAFVGSTLYWTSTTTIIGMNPTTGALVSKLTLAKKYQSQPSSAAWWGTDVGGLAWVVDATGAVLSEGSVATTGATPTKLATLSGVADADGATCRKL